MYDGAAISEVLDTYWRFAFERQRIYWSRLKGKKEPWTSDPILNVFKFTNAYRAADRVSQYLIRNVIYQENLTQTPEDTFFRILLFKLFNKISTWELLEKNLGAITYRTYSYEAYDRVLTNALEDGERIYSAAYIMPSGGSFGHKRKHRNNLALLEMMMRESACAKLGRTKCMREGFELIRSYPTIGDFLAYQYVIDLNYSDLTDFSEDEFVVPGPGAVDGIRKVFPQQGHLSHSDVIRLMADLQDVEFARLGLDFPNLFGRKLQLIDCQNLFCEVDKYSRVAHPNRAGKSGRTKIKQKFAETGDLPSPWFPPKWGINDRATELLSSAS